MCTNFMSIVIGFLVADLGVLAIEIDFAFSQTSISITMDTLMKKLKHVCFCCVFVFYFITGSPRLSLQ